MMRERGKSRIERLISLLRMAGRIPFDIWIRRRSVCADTMKSASRISATDSLAVPHCRGYQKNTVPAIGYISLHIGKWCYIMKNAKKCSNLLGFIPVKGKRVKVTGISER